MNKIKKEIGRDGEIGFNELDFGRKVEGRKTHSISFVQSPVSKGVGNK